MERALEEADRGVEVGARHRAAHVVHDDVDAAEHLARRVGERAHLVDVVEVGHDDVRLATGRLDRGRCLAQLLLGAGGDDDVGAGLGQRDRRRGADAAPGAGDDRDLVVDAEPVEDAHCAHSCSLLLLTARRCRPNRVESPSDRPLQ